jgi:murein DD-endopeptidase MepM/ murein hydrolase activator NlpD
MKKTNRFFAGIGLFLGLASLSGCGSAIGNVDPLSLFNDSSIPDLEPIVQNFTVFNSGQAFSSATPFWRLSNGGGFGGGSFVAPARGIVTSNGYGSFNGISGPALTIVHSGRLATRIVGINPIVRTGDSVIAGQLIGTITGFNATDAAFQVLLDGSPVCPLSFLSVGFRTQIGGWNLGTYCQ